MFQKIHAYCAIKKQQQISFSKNVSRAAAYSNSKGFSLIELLISLAIIALLSAIAIPSYQVYFKKARANQVKSDLLMLASQLENYRQNKATYTGASAANIYSASSPKGDENALFALYIEVDDLGLNYLLRAKAIENSEAKDDGVFWFNPVGKNCHFENRDAPYGASCQGGEEWN